MMQQKLFDMPNEPVQGRIVNVASVPQRSPFRYPGGKTWLIPIIRQWIKSQPKKPAELIEPFAGGGIVSLTAAFEELVGKVTMVERDEQVAAVWETILNGGNQWLADRIVRFEVTPENVQYELARTDVTRHELAFQTILRNRMNHGGILAQGSGLLKHGENGKGLKSRWYADTLYKRLQNIALIKDRIEFISGDAFAIMKKKTGLKNALFFIDPPYTAAGKKAGSRLYTHCDLDHEALFLLTGKLQGDFLMTYDNAEGVSELARRSGFDTQPIAMKNTHHAEMTELLIGKDLDWVRHPQG